MIALWADGRGRWMHPLGGCVGCVVEVRIPMLTGSVQDVGTRLAVHGGWCKHLAVKHLDFARMRSEQDWAWASR